MSGERSLYITCTRTGYIYEPIYRVNFLAVIQHRTLPLPGLVNSLFRCSFFFFSNR